MYLIPVAVVTMCVGLVYGQSSTCRTPDDKNGECISIYKCEPLLTLVNNSKKTDQDLTLLKKSHCGYLQREPKVCCPKLLESEPVYRINAPCNTPDGKPGKCVSLHSCPHISNALTPPVPQEIINFVKNSRCKSPEQHSVCCDTRPVKETPHDCGAKMTAFPPDPSSQCCGVSAYVPHKIFSFGGLATALDEHPWTVMIEYINKKDGTTGLFCGGALISGKYVLTAAHCIAGRILQIATPKIVRLGEYNITHEGRDCAAIPEEWIEDSNGVLTRIAEDCSDGLTRIAIERTIPHPKYNLIKSNRNDIGLIRLKETAPFTDFIRPVCLPTKDLTQPENTPPSFSMYAVGWGATETRTQSDVKLYVKVPFVSQEKCQPAYNITGRTASLWRGQLCAGGIEGVDTCKGDSGGPLVYEKQLNKFDLIGIVSSGPKPCGQKGVPGIYSNVYEYLDWIKSVIVA